MDAYKIGVSLQLSGDLQRQMGTLLRDMGKLETAARNVQKEVGRWGIRSQTFDSIKRMENNLRGLVGVSQRTGRDMGNALRGGLTPALTEARQVRSTIQGWGTAATQATSRINAAAGAMRRAAGAAAGGGGGAGRAAGAAAGAAAGGGRRGGRGHYGSWFPEVAAGYAGWGMIKSIFSPQAEMSHELSQLSNMGVTPAQLKEAQEEARRTTLMVKGVTEQQALKTYGAAYSLVGHENALKMNRQLSISAEASGARSGDYKKAYEDLYTQLRAGEELGRLTDEHTGKVDISKMVRFLDLGARMGAATHNRVDAKTLFNLAQQGGPAVSGMTDQGLAEMAMVAQITGGHRAGTMLTALYQQMVGGKMTGEVYGKLEELGLAKGHDELVHPETRTREGKVVPAKYKHVRDGVLPELKDALTKQHPVAAIDIIRRQMEEHGLDTLEKQVPVLFEMLGRQTTQRLVHQILRNSKQMTDELGRMGLGKGFEESKASNDANDAKQALHNFEASWTKFLTALGNSQTAITILNAMSAGLDALTKALHGMDTQQLTALGNAIMGFGAVFATGAVLMILGAIGPAGWMLAGLGALGGAMLAYRPQLEEFGAALKKLGEVLLQAVEGLAAEIKSWPSKIAEAVAEMGAGIVELLKKAFGGIPGQTVPKNGGEFYGDPNVFKGSYSGGGDGSHTWSDIGKGRMAGAGGPGGSNGIGGGSGSNIASTGLREQVRQYLRAGAIARGIDPNIAEKGIRQESNFNPYAIGDHGKSFGVMQLYTGGGLGNTAMRRGINPRDASQWKRHIDFGLDVAKKDGWRQWYGFRDRGISRWQGIRRGAQLNSRTQLAMMGGDHSHRGGSARISPDDPTWIANQNRAQILRSTKPPRAPIEPYTPPREPRTMVAHLHVDGRKMATNVSRHQFASAYAPSHGAAMADGSLVYPQV